MNLDQLIKAMTPEIYHNMKTAVELGKWPDGTKLTDEQKETAIQAVMIYDATHHNETDEPFRVKSDGSVKLGKDAATQALANDASIIVKQSINDD
ncbi:YeaC family protein [Pleionea sediminis]|uniref:YeaC family protein n=1 Tax=Pleionea sediminis TaxID=2569479 RepID=UPI0011855218|nr:DUF1315 family protein [Pleionea sediminis]